jgi:hypothetical protein
MFHGKCLIFHGNLPIFNRKAEILKNSVLYNDQIPLEWINYQQKNGFMFYRNGQYSLKMIQYSIGMVKFSRGMDSIPEEWFNIL